MFWVLLSGTASSVQNLQDQLATAVQLTKLLTMTVNKSENLKESPAAIITFQTFFCGREKKILKMPQISFVVGFFLVFFFLVFFCTYNVSQCGKMLCCFGPH